MRAPKIIETAIIIEYENAKERLSRIQPIGGTTTTAPRPRIIENAVVIVSPTEMYEGYHREKTRRNTEKHREKKVSK